MTAQKNKFLIRAKTHWIYKEMDRIIFYLQKRVLEYTLKKESKMKKIIYVIMVCLTFASLNACSLVSGEQNNSASVELNFAEKIALAPIGQVVQIENSPYGKNISFVVDEAYVSALGTTCRYAKALEAELSFVVCNENKNAKQKDTWVVIPPIQ